MGATRDLPRLTVGPRANNNRSGAAATPAKRGGIQVRGENGLQNLQPLGKGAISFGSNAGPSGTPILPDTTSVVASTVGGRPASGLAARTSHPFTGSVVAGTTPPSAASAASLAIGTGYGYGYDHDYGYGYGHGYYGSGYGYGCGYGFGFGFGYPYYSHCGYGYWPYGYRCHGYYSSYWYSPSWCYGYYPYGYRYSCYGYPYYGYSYYPGYHVYYDDDDYYYYDTTYVFYGRAADESEKSRGVLEDLSEGELSFCEGWGLLGRGEYDPAARAFAAALEKLPRNGLVSYFAGVALAGAGELEIAAAAFETAIREHPALVTYSWDTDKHFGTDQRYEQLLSEISAAAKLNPSSSAPWVCLAALAQMGGRSDQARRAAGEAIFSNTESDYGEAVLAELTRRDEGEPLDPLSTEDSEASNWLVNPSCESIPRLKLTEPLTL